MTRWRPCGPAIVPAEFVGDVHDLRIQLAVHGEPMMDARTNEMIYKCDEMIATISEHVTLHPVNICFPKSLSGSADRHGNRWMRPSDTIRAEIKRIGVLEIEMRADDEKGRWADGAPSALESMHYIKYPVTDLVRSLAFYE